MKFHPTPIAGVWRIALEKQEDARGFFARSFCAEECAAHGIVETFPQMNLSHNIARHTLRGMHYADVSHPESKIVRCVRGAMHDVVVDLRPGSPTFRQHAAFKLDAVGGESLYIPPGVAHGFLTLEAETDVLYLMGAAYKADAARGVRFDDPALGIAWPAAPAVISERDAGYALL